MCVLSNVCIDKRNIGRHEGFAMQREELVYITSFAYQANFPLLIFPQATSTLGQPILYCFCKESLHPMIREKGIGE